MASPEDEQEKRQIRAAFHEAVNMTPAELEKWLDTPESQEVGFTHDGEDEAVGHKSGRRIVEIKRKGRGELSDDDFAHMKRSSATFTATWRRAVQRRTRPTAAGATR